MPDCRRCAIEKEESQKKKVNQAITKCNSCGIWICTEHSIQKKTKNGNVVFICKAH